MAASKLHIVSDLKEVTVKMSQNMIQLILRNWNKHAAIQNLSIYYTWKSIRQQNKNNKLKIIAPRWNDEFESPDGSYPIHDYTNRIIKKHETIPTNLPIHIYINRINNRLVFKLTVECKLELQIPEPMKLFGSTKKPIEKTQNGENVPSPEVVEVVLVQCNLVDNQYQQKSEVLHTITPNRSYACLVQHLTRQLSVSENLKH